MFRSKKNRDEHRYYLLPGMARSNRRFHRLTVRWAIAIGFLISAIFGALLYHLNR